MHSHSWMDSHGRDLFQFFFAKVRSPDVDGFSRVKSRPPQFCSKKFVECDLLMGHLLSKTKREAANEMVALVPLVSKVSKDTKEITNCVEGVVVISNGNTPETNTPENAKFPMSPEQDTDNKWIWVCTTITASDHLQRLQNSGYVMCRAKNDPFTFNGTTHVYLRKLRHRQCHRFETVSQVYISDAIVTLGKCSKSHESITRDVVHVSPADKLRMASITLTFSEFDEQETYLCNGASYQVCYYPPN